MTQVTCNPYLFFDGNCRDAMAFYRSVFGGELRMTTFGEANHDCPTALKDAIMHAFLTGGDIILMASDTPSDEALGSGQIFLALGGTDETKLRQIFSELANGGHINHELKRESWGGIYGDLQDKFGIRWMVNISPEEPAFQ